MSRLNKIFLFSFLALAVVAIVVNIGTSTTVMVTGTGGGVPSELILIWNLQFIKGVEGSNDAINATIANVGQITATITTCQVKEETSGNVITSFEIDSPHAVIAENSFKVFTLTLKQDTLVNGTKYYLTVTTARDRSTVSSTFDTSSSAAYDPLKDEKLLSMLQSSASKTPEPFWSLFLKPVVVGSFIVAMISVVGAYKLAHFLIGPENRKELYILFFFISVIFVSIILAVVSAIWFPSIPTM